MWYKVFNFLDIDFGYILGYFKFKFGIKRERIKFVVKFLK